MPKNSSTTILRRWRKMDWALYRHRELRIETFARENGVDKKTIRRDLEDLELLGQRIEKVKEGGAGDEICYRYADGVEPLFVSTLRPKWIKKTDVR
jgi:predicted DNA-binding transcriptional regulator YafY